MNKNILMMFSIVFMCIYFTIDYIIARNDHYKKVNGNYIPIIAGVINCELVFGKKSADDGIKNISNKYYKLTLEYSYDNKIYTKTLRFGDVDMSVKTVNIYIDKNNPNDVKKIIDYLKISKPSIVFGIIKLLALLVYCFVAIYFV